MLCLILFVNVFELYTYIYEVCGICNIVYFNDYSLYFNVFITYIMLMESI